MNRRKKSYPAVQFGTSLMLVVFITLCLTAFATLSLSSAMRDYEYSRKAADKAYDYYQADAKANEKLAEVTGVIKNTSKSLQSGQFTADTYIEEVVAKLEKLSDITMTESRSGEPAVSYSVPVNDNQVLQVTLVLYTPGTSGDRLYKITQWKEVSSKKWNSTTTLPVIASD